VFGRSPRPGAARPRRLSADRDRARLVSPPHRAWRRRRRGPHQRALRGRDATRRASPGRPPAAAPRGSDPEWRWAMTVVDVATATDQAEAEAEQENGFRRLPAALGVLPLRDSVTFPDL